MNPVAVFGAAASVAFAPVCALVFLGGGSTAVQSAACAIPAPQASAQLGADQLANATVIVDVGQQLSVPTYGQVIAVATALQESDLRDLSYGDADSLGLFQQRPSQGWGSPAQILDPSYAATMFYAHLLAVPGWESMPLTLAAQAVQRSAFPDAYGSWQTDATTIVRQVIGDGPFHAGSTNPTPPPPGSPFVSLPPSLLLPLAPEPSTPVMSAAGQPSLASAPHAADDEVCGVAVLPPGSVGQVIGFAAAQVGKAYVLGGTGPNSWDCSALVQAAYATAGVALPRTADEQYDYADDRGQVFTGPPTPAVLQPGDLLFSPGDDPVPAADGNPIGHVAIYAGNGVVVEAKGVAWGVIATTYTPADYAAVTFVGRLVADTSASEPSSSPPASPPANTSPSS